MNDPDPQEQLAALRAATDQWKEGIKELAGVIGAYFVALVELGFERAEALQLTLSYQSIFLAAVMLGQQSPEEE